MNTKILYITCANKNSLSGGSLCAKRNLETLQTIFGISNVYTYILKPQTKKRGFKDLIIKFYEVLRLLGGGLTIQYLNDIKKIIKAEPFTHVFLDSSALGILAKYIRNIKPNIKIYTFFHNVEFDYMVSTTIKSGDYKHAFWIFSARYNEMCACKYSSHIIALNQKDKNRIKRLYKSENISIIPITLKDVSIFSGSYHDEKISYPLNALFIGSYFPGNIKGIKWFCKDILPYVRINMTIAGSGMEKLREEIPNDNKLTIKGRVDDLAQLYQNADLVILPITSGGGMKVKTAEALMWGKHIIGTPEALEGYNLNEDIATKCVSAKEFINAISQFGKSKSTKFNDKAREIYNKYFSYEYSLTLYKRMFKK